jgi:chromosome partitioning protein
MMMPGKLIAVANSKGGVGKTTIVVSLAEALAADNPRVSVLVVDLDPQASASVCLAGDNLLAEMIEDGRTVESFLEDRLINGDRTQLAPKIRKNVSCTTHGGNQLKISLLPCGPHLRVVEREIIYSLEEKKFNMRGIEGQTWILFEQEFLPLGKIYDYVIFDCPPGISPLSEVAIRASDLVVVPTIPDFLSVYGINGFLKIFWRAQPPKGALPPPKLKPHVLVTRFQSNVAQHRVKVEELERAASTKDPWIRLLKTKVQQSAALAGAMRNIDEVPTLNQKHPPIIKKYGGDVPTDRRSRERVRRTGIQKHIGLHVDESDTDHAAQTQIAPACPRPPRFTGKRRQSP